MLVCFVLAYGVFKEVIDILNALACRHIGIQLGDYQIAYVLQLFECRVDSRLALFADEHKPCNGVIPIIRKGKNSQEQAEGFQADLLRTEKQTAYYGKVVGLIDTAAL